MEGETVVYDGRIVPKEGFRVFIYDIDGNEKLVNTWDEYEEHISDGTWYTYKDRRTQNKSNNDEVVEIQENGKHKKRGRD